MERPRKRPAPLPTPEVAEDEEVLAEQLKCPVCLQLLSDPFLTVCGHSFCWNCIKRSLEYKSECPSCKRALSLGSLPPAPGPSDLTPNHTLKALAQRYQEALSHKNALLLTMPPSALGGVVEQKMATALSNPDLDLSTISRMIDVLQKRKRQLLHSQETTQQILVREFLEQMIERREAETERLQWELNILKADRLALVEKKEPEENCLVPQSRGPSLSFTEMDETVDEPEISAIDPPPGPSTESWSDLLRGRRAKLATHFSDLESAYLDLRGNDTAPREGPICLAEFSSILGKMTGFRSVRRLASLSYAADAGPGLSIVSSIEFDKDGAFVAVAGVTRKIKLYDYAAVLEQRGGQDLHYPASEMVGTAKISSVSFSRFSRSTLASSDYDGSIVLWDTFTQTQTQRFKEHEKRCWSVCFSSESPRTLASGSDDGVVKLWQAGLARSVNEIRVGVNVCCVQFCGTQGRGNQLVFGSADHCVHLYDIRQTRGPQAVLQGHRKAVSYVKFLQADEVVSASTDAELRIWDVGKQKCVRTLRGHHNERNFVGLATNQDYITCGSEDNQLYIYYKRLSRPLFSTPFGLDKGLGSLLSRTAPSTASTVVMGKKFVAGSEDNQLYIYYKRLSRPLFSTPFGLDKGLGSLLSRTAPSTASTVVMGKKFVAGSEDNQLYIYYKRLSRPLFSTPFGLDKGLGSLLSRTAPSTASTVVMGKKFVAGSEDNQLYIYYKRLSRPLFSTPFGLDKGLGSLLSRTAPSTASTVVMGKKFVAGSEDNQLYIYYKRLSRPLFSTPFGLDKGLGSLLSRTAPSTASTVVMGKKFVAGSEDNQLYIYYKRLSRPLFSTPFGLDKGLGSLLSRTAPSTASTVVMGKKFVAGSEDNQLYIYYKRLSRPLFSTPFGLDKGLGSLLSRTAPSTASTVVMGKKFVAGSEDNQLYIYYKRLSRPLFSTPFGLDKGLGSLLSRTAPSTASTVVMGKKFVAGSEDNQLYIYYKRLSRPLFSTPFGLDKGLGSLLSRTAPSTASTVVMGKKFVAGSEDNQLYIYYKRLSRPLFSTPFGLDKGLGSLLSRTAPSTASTVVMGSPGHGEGSSGGGEEESQDPPEAADFVSAVAWKQDSNVIVAANSQGIIRVLELV